jgi:hypothetical protein
MFDFNQFYGSTNQTAVFILFVIFEASVVWQAHVEWTACTIQSMIVLTSCSGICSVPVRAVWGSCGMLAAP